MAREMHTVKSHADTRHFVQRRNCVILQCERIDLFFFEKRNYRCISGNYSLTRYLRGYRCHCSRGSRFYSLSIIIFEYVCFNYYISLCNDVIHRKDSKRKNIRSWIYVLFLLERIYNNERKKIFYINWSYRNFMRYKSKSIKIRSILILFPGINKINLSLKKI